jgi:hypothetical protein
MKRETLYASLAGFASFFPIAYGSYLYFSPAERTVDVTSENASVSSPAPDVMNAEEDEVGDSRYSKGRKPAPASTDTYKGPGIRKIRSRLSAEEED